MFLSAKIDGGIARKTIQTRVHSKILEKAIDEYAVLTSDLSDAYLQLNVDYVAVRARLQRVIETFPESGTYQLKEIIAAQNSFQDKSAKGNARSPLEDKNGSERSRYVKVALGLVGMLRPPGFGNFQGFLGYATNLMGAPLELILGVQNDGDSPEVI